MILSISTFHGLKSTHTQQQYTHQCCVWQCSPEPTQPTPSLQGQTPPDRLPVHREHHSPPHSASEGVRGGGKCRGGSEGEGDGCDYCHGNDCTLSVQAET